MQSAEDEYLDFDLGGLKGGWCTVTRATAGEGRFIRQAPASRYGHVKVVVAPHPAIHCFRFVWRPPNRSLPRPFMQAACLEGVREALMKPLGNGRRIAFVEVAIVDGSYHVTDTDDHAVALAAFMAVTDALSRAELTMA